MRRAQPIGAWCREAYAFLPGSGFVLDESVLEPTIMQSWEGRSASCLVLVLVDWRPSGEVVTLIGPNAHSAIEVDRMAELLGLPRGSWPKKSAPNASMVERRINEQASFCQANFSSLLQGDFSSVEELPDG